MAVVVAVVAVVVVARHLASTSRGTASAQAPSTTIALPDVGPLAGYAPAHAFDALPVPVPVPSASNRVLLYGDSLVVQSFGYARQIAQRRGYRLDGGAFGGLALCDESARIEQAVRAQRPAVLVLGFVGNAITPCMGDAHARGTAAIVGRYVESARAVIAAARESHTDVWFVVGPAMRAADRDAVVRALDTAWRALAATDPAVHVIESAPLVSPSGFAMLLPCLPFEQAIGCRGSSLVRAADGTARRPRLLVGRVALRRGADRPPAAPTRPHVAWRAVDREERERALGMRERELAESERAKAARHDHNEQMHLAAARMHDVAAVLHDDIAERLRDLTARRAE